MKGFNNGKQLKRMVRRYVKGRATPQESDFLSEWGRYLDTHHDAFADLPQQERDAIRDTMLDELKSTIHAPKSKKTTLYRWLPYAAAVAVLLTVGWLMLVDSRQSSVDSLAASDILPGGNRATLVLADGRTIDLSPEQAGIVIADGITYLDGSQVMENGELKMKNEGPNEENGILNAQLSILNSITTPKGGTYQITLPDGSKVWLNANSTLKYPSRFSGDTREVILEGEAFFDIVPMDRARNAVARARSDDGSRASVMRVPFIVLTTGQTVEVLGTEFNISAYADDPETRTTLVEGSVKVLASRKSTSGSPLRSLDLTLSPGQQARLDATGLSIHKADIEQAIDWKNGKFTFNQMDIRSAMARIARWYDVEVSYRGDFSGLYFGGSVSRTNTLRQTLTILESTGNMKFEIQGRRVLVMP